MSRTPLELHSERIKWAINWTKKFYAEHKSERPDRQWPSARQINDALKKQYGTSMRPQLIYELRQAAGGPAIDRGQRRGKPPKEGVKLPVAVYASSVPSYGKAVATLQVHSEKEAAAIRSAVEAINSAGLANLTIEVDQGKLATYVIIKGR